MRQLILLFLFFLVHGSNAQTLSVDGSKRLLPVFKIETSESLNDSLAYLNKMNVLYQRCILYLMLDGERLKYPIGCNFELSDTTVSFYPINPLGAGLTFEAVFKWNGSEEVLPYTTPAE